MTTEQTTIDNETLLQTLAQNPDAAHFLADLAAGGDLHQLIEAHFGINPSSLNQPDNEPDNEPDDNNNLNHDTPIQIDNQPTIGMYQSQVATDKRPADSAPAFLTHIRPDFWGDDPIF